MARIASSDASQFETNFTNTTFGLADDQDHDYVQFLLNSPDDILTYTVHEIPMTSRNGHSYKAKVSCLRSSAHDPEGTCPLCDAGAQVKVARFIPLYSHTQKQCMIWERGPQFIQQTLVSSMNRLISMGKTPINTVIDVVRSGKKGSTSTTYALYPMDTMPPVDTRDLVIPDPEKTLLREWSREDMNAYVKDGTMPQANSNNDDANAGVVRRDRTADSAPHPATAPMPDAFAAQPAAPSDGVHVSDPTALF